MTILSICISISTLWTLWSSNTIISRGALRSDCAGVTFGSLRSNRALLTAVALFSFFALHALRTLKRALVLSNKRAAFVPYKRVDVARSRSANVVRRANQRFGSRGQLVSGKHRARNLKRFAVLALFALVSPFAL